MTRPPAVIALVLVAVATVAALVAIPRPATLSEHTAGDPALAQQLRAATPARGHQAVAAAVITPDSITHAAIGETARGSGVTIAPADPIELGSITKTFNGFLLADAIARGEVGADDPLSRHLPELAGTPVGGVTLTELATHRGGVPPLPPSLTARALSVTLTGSNPYGEATKESLIAEAGTLPLADTRGTEQYSNLGSTLLGHALAAAAGAPDWSTHVQERLLGPLGVRPVFATTPADVPPGTVPGFTSNGVQTERWVGPGFLPAGVATYVPSAEVAAYAQAILTGRVPGAEAMDPRFDGAGGTRTGLGWFITEQAGRSLTWHNGGTAGFRTILVVDREAQRAVFVVGNTEVSVDEIGLALITGTPNENRSALPLWLVWIVPVAALALIAGFWWNAVRGRDRVALVSGLAGAIVGLALAHVAGAWALTGSWVWVVLVLLTAGAAVLAIRRWPQLPWQPARYRVLRWLNAGISALLALAALGLAALA